MKKGELPWITATLFIDSSCPLFCRRSTGSCISTAIWFRPQRSRRAVSERRSTGTMWAWHPTCSPGEIIPHESYFKDRLGVDGEYFNAGVAIYDLAGMRRDGIEQLLLDYLVANGPLGSTTGTFLNAALRGKIRKLDQTWNMTQRCWSSTPERVSAQGNETHCRLPRRPLDCPFCGRLEALESLRRSLPNSLR